MATEYIADYYNISEATDIISDSFFSSYATNGHTTLFTKWNLLTSANSTGYLTGNPLADMMLHIRYNISNNADETSWSHYPVIDQSGNMVLHENPYYLPLGIFIEHTDEREAWTSTDYSSYDEDGHGGNAFEFQNAFSHAMGCGDLYHMITPETDSAKIENDTDSELTYILADPSDYIEGKQTEVPTEIHVGKDVEGDVYFSYFNTIAFAGNTSAGEADVFDMTMYLPYGRKDYYMRLAVFDEEEMKKLWEKLNVATLQDIEISFNKITGKINPPTDGALYLSLPYMEGWSIYVDGKEAIVTPFMGGTGISIKAGEHVVEIKYTPRGAWLGIAASCGTLLLLIVFVVVRKQVVRRKKNSEAEASATDEKDSAIE